jgi:Tfp pilus assembly protein PilZ
MDETRASRRVSPLIIRAKFQLGEKLLEGYVTNLSETGAFLATEERTEVGESFGLILDMPWTLGEVTAEAEVVWRTDQSGRGAERLPTGMGLLFLDVSDEGKKKLRTYIQKFCQLATQIGQQAVRS